jgi:hypothetical protein
VQQRPCSWKEARSNKGICGGLGREGSGKESPAQEVSVPSIFVNSVRELCTIGLAVPIQWGVGSLDHLYVNSKYSKSLQRFASLCSHAPSKSAQVILHCCASRFLALGLLCRCLSGKIALESTHFARLSRHASLVLFYSKKCQLCKSLTPMVNEMARKESWWLDVCYVNVDDQNWMPEVRD